MLGETLHAYPRDWIRAWVTGNATASKGNACSLVNSVLMKLGALPEPILLHPARVTANATSTSERSTRRRTRVVIDVLPRSSALRLRGSGIVDASVVAPGSAVR